MKMGTKWILVVAVLILACSGYSNAEVLGTISRSDTVRGGPGGPTLSGATFSIIRPQAVNIEPYAGNEGLLSGWSFESAASLSWNVSADDIGESLYATAETHPGFAAFVDFLTNSADDPFYLELNGQIPDPIIDGIPVTGFESELIDGVNTGVDFAGYSIDSISLTVNELVFVDTGYSFDFGRIEYDITYTIHGSQSAVATPEPATLALLSLGGMALLRRKRRSSRVLRSSNK